MGQQAEKPNGRGIRAVESGEEVVLTVNHWPVIACDPERRSRWSRNSLTVDLIHSAMLAREDPQKIRQVGAGVVAHSLCDRTVRFSLVISYKPRKGTGSKLHSVRATNQVQVSKMQEAEESRHRYPLAVKMKQAISG